MFRVQASACYKQKDSTANDTKIGPNMISRILSRPVFPVIVLLFLIALPLHGQTNQPPDPPAGFEKIEQMIAMRDGVKLHTIIYAPKSHRELLPILFNRTPYGIDNIYRGFPGSLQELIEEGFIFAFQDIRGKFKSEGQFVMQRPPRGPGNPTAIDEGTDTYDTIEWMIKNVPHNNGRAGRVGVSYP